MKSSSTPVSLSAPPAAPAAAPIAAEQRHEEDESDQAAPECATRGAEACERGLVELDVAVVLALDDHDVVELYHVALDGLVEVGCHLLRRR
jgi:hypothetical protein